MCVSGLNPNIDYLRNGDNEVTFNVHFSGQGFTVGVKYYDKRDGKNVILATAGNAERYQRLLFVTSSINRTFIKEAWNDNNFTFKHFIYSVFSDISTLHWLYRKLYTCSIKEIRFRRART